MYKEILDKLKKRHTNQAIKLRGDRYKSRLPQADTLYEVIAAPRLGDPAIIGVFISKSEAQVALERSREDWPTFKLSIREAQDEQQQEGAQKLRGVS